MNINKIASIENTVLITGETGTGKTHLAKKIHDLSNRRTKIFCSINLATISENLIESELFGHERGSFTGAEQKRVGRLEIANGGTVLLDEIGELPLRLQVKLLDILNHKVITPVGSNREIKLDIRFIAATNVDLKKAVLKKRFREDLFYRIQTVHLKLNPLRENKEQIKNHTASALKEFSQKFGKNFSLDSQSLDFIEKYYWPGNIRELKNAIEYACAISEKPEIVLNNLPNYLFEENHDEKEIYRHFPTHYQDAKAQFERTYLQEILRRFHGKINLTARSTGISKVTLIEKIKKYELDIQTIKYEIHCQKRGISA
ncbi:MAG: sigma-54 dependent transcriptional regulator [Oligoflexia bacterium]|nr:sigma-54 dependent transcriptional regulator [Oligoflexia bacterium]